MVLPPGFEPSLRDPHSPVLTYNTKVASSLSTLIHSMSIAVPTPQESVEKGYGARTTIRTPDLLITNQLLYRLSYEGLIY